MLVFTDLPRAGRISRDGFTLRRRGGNEARSGISERDAIDRGALRLSRGADRRGRGPRAGGQRRLLAAGGELHDQGVPRREEPYADGLRDDRLQEQFPRHAHRHTPAPLSERLPREGLPAHPGLYAGNVSLYRGASGVDARVARREGPQDRRRCRAVHRRRDDSHGDPRRADPPRPAGDDRNDVRGKDRAPSRTLGIFRRPVQRRPVVSQDRRIRQGRLASGPVPDGRILRRIRNLRRVDHAAGEVRPRGDRRAGRGGRRLEEESAAARRRHIRAERPPADIPAAIPARQPRRRTPASPTA